MSAEPKKASDEQIALLRKLVDFYVRYTRDDFREHAIALTAVLDQLERQSVELEQYRKELTLTELQAVLRSAGHYLTNGQAWDVAETLLAQYYVTPKQALSDQAQELGMYEVASAEQTGAHELTKSQAAYSAAAREATEKVCEWRRCNTATPAYESSCGEFFMGIGQLHCPKCQGRIVVVTGEIRASFPVRNK